MKLQKMGTQNRPQILTCGQKLDSISIKKIFLVEVIP